MRGIGGYVIAPGATRPDNRSWQPIPSESGAPEWPTLPAWLQRLTCGHNQRSISSPISSIISRKPSSREERYALAALAGVAQEISAAPLGKRNTILNATAYRLGRMVGAGWIDRNTVENELRLAAHALANDDGIKSVMTTIASGLAAGCSDPHPPLANRKRGWKLHLGYRNLKKPKKGRKRWSRVLPRHVPSLCRGISKVRNRPHRHRG